MFFFPSHEQSQTQLFFSFLLTTNIRQNYFSFPLISKVRHNSFFPSFSPTTSDGTVLLSLSFAKSDTTLFSFPLTTNTRQNYFSFPLICKIRQNSFFPSHQEKLTELFAFSLINNVRQNSFFLSLSPTSDTTRFPSLLLVKSNCTCLSAFKFRKNKNDRHLILSKIFTKITWKYLKRLYSKFIQRNRLWLQIQSPNDFGISWKLLWRYSSLNWLMLPYPLLSVNL